MSQLRLSSADHRCPVVMSFDVEEHHRIEAAAGLRIAASAQSVYRARMEDTTRWLLDQLAERGVRATFYVVGELAELSTALVRDIARAGHEVGSHGWDHRRVLALTPAEFRDDVRRSKDALEQVTGTAVAGYRAPTFSVVRRTVWALEVLAEAGYRYDSSIYPVRHDRYGMPGVPRTPFVVPTPSGPIVELPPLTLRLFRVNLPVGGGGYFRLLPLWFMRRGIRQMDRQGTDTPAMLYFHPWEFDSGQEQLPLRWLSRVRTYRGIDGSRTRLRQLLGADYRFERAADVVGRLSQPGVELPVVPLLDTPAGLATSPSDGA